MREAYYDELEGVFADLTEITRLVEVAVQTATEALLTGDAETAERVITADAEIDSRREKVENDAFNLLSLQQPVAGDLRLIVAALRIVSELERMGDLAEHVAKVARLRVPGLAVPEDLRPTITRMATIALEMVGRLRVVIADRDVQAAARLAETDEEMDKLRRLNFTELLRQDWTHGVEAAVDVALLGRYYERIADHAVGIANRVVFVVTGDFPVA
ncbi:phosphate signaling complex protein PhoU [uncultured Nocardioides sp.]|uniref:phosphate signaling complex protein PhoU n=1 Tax=uncultured Nocardioides sp. TaxID=198441 RepID=UPI002603D349|nr:phosphate signaling complex protein PhoU [uncultured Nocardioides sp.]